MMSLLSVGDRPSPDPLALGIDNLLDDCIEAAAPTSRHAPLGSERPKRTPTRYRGRVKPVVELSSPKKRRRSEPSVEAKQAREPLATASPSSNRATPTPQAKRTTKSQALITPTKQIAKTPVSRPSVTLSAQPTLASSVSKPLPTPSPARTRKELRLASPQIEDAFTEPIPPSISAISRDTFLANEALRRQREVRKFVYKGDANAPKFTRSGKVVGGRDTRDTTDEVDVYGTSLEDLDGYDEAQTILPDSPSISLPTPKIVADASTKSSPILPLSVSARPYVLKILSTLTSQNIAVDPDPFVNEEKNEALHGLVNLLRGTVERGEGNSALVLGARGVGKTRTIARALNLLPSSSKMSPIVVRLSGHAQTNDRLAIREMGRQIAEAEGKKEVAAEPEDDGDDDEQGEDQEFAPTTLPSHLLALLNAPSPRAIIIIIEEFDLFTEHARQALLYCLLDVVQSIKTGPVESTGRGVAVIGVTSRVDNLLLLEKRVKSRFSHRMWRVSSPLSGDGIGWKEVMKRTLVPWEPEVRPGVREGAETKKWKGDWQFAVEVLLDHEKVVRSLDRLCGLTTDVRILYRPFIEPICAVLDSQLDFLSVSMLVDNVIQQVDGAGWGLQNAKLKGLPESAVSVLIIAKHLAYAGREDFNFAQVEEEYLRFARTKLVGSGRTRWPIGILRSAFEHLLRLSLLSPTHNSTEKPQFARVRCTLSPHEIVAWCKGEGATGLGPELAGWGRMMGGHA